MAVRVRQASRLPYLITANARQARRLSYQSFPKTYMHPQVRYPLTRARRAVRFRSLLTVKAPADDA